MHKIALFTALLLLSLLTFQCGEDEPLPGVSDCLQNLMTDYIAASGCGSNNAKIVRYTSSVGYLYYFSYDDCCCDYASPFYDNDCNQVCFLGGFVGSTECKVNGETLELTDPVVIWQK